MAANTTNHALPEKRFIDLNCDFGESYGAYSFGQDDELLPYVSSVNIACGFHAGDPLTMREAVERAVQAGAAIGAHPGLPDRMGFGRRELAITPQEAYDYTLYQLGALDSFVRAAGGRLSHVKPHGALYHMAGRSEELAEAFVRAVHAYDASLFIYGQWGSTLLGEADKLGLPRASEVFADRTYRADGTLTPRTQPGALHRDADAALSQTIDIIVKGRVRTIEGTEIPMHGDTVCLHGDGPQAAVFAAHLHRGLVAAGIELRPPRVSKRG
ncbi:LamB/YcsF family protein [Paenibacillus sp. R14(2021)]|uniref:LamB/YcsF family protein n=1 Tax=Paenibacillus sp. R14(2021) TaxID=2859228 RepID=UPI001C612D63|nr:5-oxoprolinase subunit PxpA [Paenibacillus sp. R14(2021)]